MNRKIVIGLSDGVDSAVAAYLLKQDGWEVHGVYLDIAGEKEKQDAQSSAEKLGIELTVTDIREERKTRICDLFADWYTQGLTMNPCVLCNPWIKLPSLIKRMREVGAEKIATGHYVRTDGKHLYKGNKDNDQSYMFSMLQRNQVERLVLPLGEYDKTDVRRIAEEIGLTVSQKPDSRENCFVPKGMYYADWLEQHYEMPGPGPVFFGEREIGMHDGIHRYTVGMRWKEDMDGRRLYVTGIDPEKNALKTDKWENTFTNRVLIYSMHWIEPPEKDQFEASVRVRHTRWEEPVCRVTLERNAAGKNVRTVLETETPLRAPAPGQPAALYRGDMLLGGGFVMPQK
ncbi:MAG: tRNA 2-thiouridine(34) synthase MnmA [Clostridiales bacterium]|nr:tRNA 2-thiouridine(34) synthase MnmA [Clostridiales bacterium]